MALLSKFVYSEIFDYYLFFSNKSSAFPLIANSISFLLKNSSSVAFIYSTVVISDGIIFNSIFY